MSDAVRIGLCPPERLDEFLRPLSLMLLGREVGDAASVARFAAVVDGERLHAAFDGDAIVGAAAAFTFDLTVPGGAAVPTAGVTVVAVLSTHRRRGLLRRLMEAQIADVHERGESLAALWASEAGIYGRFGYGIAGSCLEIEIPRQRAALRDPAPAGVRTRLLSADEAAERFPPLYDAARATTPGMLSRTPAWWRERRLSDHDASGGALQRVLVELDGEPVGYALYRVAMRWGDGLPRHRLVVLEALGSTPAGTGETWRFLLSLDLVERIEADLLPVDHPLLHLLVDPRQVRARIGDAEWLRLVDVKAALEARRYAQPGTLVLEVADALCPWNAGPWRLEVDDQGRGAAERAAGGAELALDVAALARPYLGAFRFTELVAGGLVDERVAGAAQRGDGLFRWAPAPWCPEIF